MGVCGGGGGVRPHLCTEQAKGRGLLFAKEQRMSSERMRLVEQNTDANLELTGIKQGGVPVRCLVHFILAIEPAESQFPDVGPIALATHTSVCGPYG